VKALSSTKQLPLKLSVLNDCEVVGMCSVAVKCLDITQNTDSEGILLTIYWRWWTKAWGANRIRYPGSPRCKRWIL